MSFRRKAYEAGAVGIGLRTPPPRTNVVYLKIPPASPVSVGIRVGVLVVAPATLAHPRRNPEMECQVVEVGDRRSIPRLVLVVPPARVPAVDAHKVIAGVGGAAAVAVVRPVAWRAHQPIFETGPLLFRALSVTAVAVVQVTVVATLTGFNLTIAAAGNYGDVQASLARVATVFSALVGVVADNLRSPGALASLAHVIPRALVAVIARPGDRFIHAEEN